MFCFVVSHFQISLIELVDLELLFLQLGIVVCPSILTSPESHGDNVRTLVFKTE